MRRLRRNGRAKIARVKVLRASYRIAPLATCAPRVNGFIELVLRARHLTLVDLAVGLFYSRSVSTPESTGPHGPPVGTMEIGRWDTVTFHRIHSPKSRGSRKCLD